MLNKNLTFWIRRSLTLSLFAAGQAFLFQWTNLQAGETIPGTEWKDDYDPIASPDAEPGGVLKVNGGQYPASFNYYTDANVFSAKLFGYQFETLLGMHPITAKQEPGIAEKVEVSDDKLQFKVFIDKRAKWSDGKPITSHDVKFTFDTVMDEKNLTGPHKVRLATFNSPEIIDDHTLVFEAKEVHWRNLNSLGGFAILPKHQFEGKDFNKENFEFPVVSGPYQLGEVKEGVFARLERRKDWWQQDFKRNQGILNFDTLEYRFYMDRQSSLDSFLKGETDYFGVHTSHFWVNQTNGEAFDNSWIIKQAVYNSNPIGFQGFAMNMRLPKFADLKTRQALAHLVDRRKMNANLMFNQYFMHKSYYEDIYDAENPCDNMLYEFDKDKARALLSEAGWKANPETGILERDGEPFKITFLTRSPSSDKFLVIVKEDLKDVGIELEIERKDWAAWSKDMDEFKYDMTWASWSGGLYKDPEPSWSSYEADKPSGYNITGFKSDEVDQLIEEQKGIFDIGARHDIARRVDKIVAEAVPYVLLWNINYTRLLYWNKFGTPDTVLNKYSDYDAAETYWWSDLDAEADLEQAMESKEALPPKEFKIVFEDQYVGN